MILTKEKINALKTKNGGITNYTIIYLGIKPPLQKGWFKNLLHKEISIYCYNEALKGKTIYRTKFSDIDKLLNKTNIDN